MDEKKVREAIETIKSNYPTSGYYMLCEALDIAIEALEKQLPKKVAFKRNAYGGISVCPICGASDYGKYCRQCGQRINWEEEENERTREDFGRDRRDA